MILAQLGAEVVKIERPGSGDEARSMGPLSSDGWSAYFLAIKRGKQSIAIDLSKPEGVALVLRLARKADVFVENFGARAGVSVLDMGSGMWVALGILAALLERTRSGRGTRVDGSLYQTGVMWMAYHLVARQITGRDPAPQGTRIGAFAPYGDFATADSRVLIGISNDRLFARLCDSLGRAELAADLRFAKNPQRVENRDALDREIETTLRTRTTAAWLEHFDAAGVPASQIQTAGEVLADPQLAALGQMQALAEIEGFAPALPIELGGFTPLHAACPRLGQHTAEILRGSGLSDDEIRDLAGRGIIAIG